jgi:hypothetical protein
MAKKKLLEDIKQRPMRFYRIPGDVLRDRRFADPERLAILQAWAADADGVLAQQIAGAIADMESRQLANPHAAE